LKRNLSALFLVLLFAISSFGDVIILKDEQKFQADIRGFDSYYVEVQLENKKIVSIPWNEIRYIRHTTTPSDPREESYMTPEEVEVSTMVTPLSRDEAMQKALYPGLILHGAGHFYAKDQNTGASLVSAEIVSLAIMGLSVPQFFAADTINYDYGVTKAVFISGLVIFAGSWLWDVIFAPGAADSYNSKHDFLLGGKENTGTDTAGRENATNENSAGK
jgi:hypothetical protein